MNKLKLLLLLVYLLNLSCLAQDITTGLVGYWPFDGNANDLSTNGNNGTGINITYTTDRFSFSNNALSLNGTGSYVIILGSTSLDLIENNDAITYAAWINIRQLWGGTHFCPFNKRKISTDYGWSMAIWTPSTIGFGSNWVESRTTWDFSINQWYHLAFTYDRSTGFSKYYINGQLLSTQNYVADITDTENGNLYFGYSPDGPDEYSDGIIDEVRFYNRALTECDIMALYAYPDPLNNPAKIESTSLVRMKSMICNFSLLDTLWIKNTGGCDLTISSSSFSGANSSDFQLVQPPNWPQTIKASDSIKVIIKFNPSSNGSKTAKLNLENNSADNPWVIDLSARKDSIAFNLNSAVGDTLIIDFGTFCPGTTKDTSFTIRNTSTIPTTFNIGNLDSPFNIEGISGTKRKEDKDGILRKDKK